MSTLFSFKMKLDRRFQRLHCCLILHFNLKNWERKCRNRSFIFLKFPEKDVSGCDNAPSEERNWRDLHEKITHEFREFRVRRNIIYIFSISCILKWLSTHIKQLSSWNIKILRPSTSDKEDQKLELSHCFPLDVTLQFQQRSLLVRPAQLWVSPSMS